MKQAKMFQAGAGQNAFTDVIRLQKECRGAAVPLPGDFRTAAIEFKSRWRPADAGSGR